MGVPDRPMGEREGREKVRRAAGWTWSADAGAFPVTDTTDQTRTTPKCAEPLVAPLHTIGIAPENLRAAEPADVDIPELANTIEAAGLLYPLLVRAGRKGERPFMALDGRRRLLALDLLAANSRIAVDFGVKVEVVKDKGLQAAAIVVSNTQRAPVHVADVIVAIGKLKSLKLTAAKIAAAIGYSEIEVRRLQCLAGLPKDAIEALRRGRMNLRTAKLLARVTDPDTLALFCQQATAGYLSEHTISHHLNGRPGLDDPMFDLIGIERYQEAGGRIDADLFGELDDVVLDSDLLQGLWKARVEVLIGALKARGYAVFLQAGELYRAPAGFELGDRNASNALPLETRVAWQVARDVTEESAQSLSQGDRYPAARDADLEAFLIARLDEEAKLHGSERIGAVGLYAEAGTGFEIQAYLKPHEVSLDEAVSADDGVAPDRDAVGVPDSPGERAYRPEIVVPRQEIDTEGRNHALHETYTDVATRGLIRSVADDPMVALTITVARMFVILALQGGTSTEQSASTLQGRRYSRGSLAPIPTLDGVVRERLGVKRTAYLASGLRPIPWINQLAHGEKMELLAELIAVSLDLREVSHTTVRRAARAEAAEIADLTAHDITAYWTPDIPFLAQHTKGQLTGALASMEADVAPTKGMRKDDLVGYVASVAAEKVWAPPSLNLRLEMTVLTESPLIEGEASADGPDHSVHQPVSEAGEQGSEAQDEAPDSGTEDFAQAA